MLIKHEVVLLNKISQININSISCIKRNSTGNKISFKGEKDIFNSKPEVIFGDIEEDEFNKIIEAIKSNKKISSGWTSCIYSCDDKIIKVPTKTEYQAQNLKEYYILNKINELNPTITTKPKGLIKNKNFYYLVEEFIDGKHPKGNHLSSEHLKDLFSKFIKLDTNGITNYDLQSGNIFLLNENKTRLIDFGSYSHILDNGQIISSDYISNDFFKPNGKINDLISLDGKTRFLKTFLQNNDIDIKSQADNPYLKVLSNATNFEYRTLYSHLLDNSEENPLEFFKTHLKAKAETYHSEMKNFLNTLSFDEIKSGEFSEECIAIGKDKLKQAINYETLAKEILSNPNEDVVKVELAKLQLRTFLNLTDSLNSPIENSKKIKSAYANLLSVLNNGIKNSNGDKKNYFIQTLNDFKKKFKNYNFCDNQVEIPENEDLIKVLFKKNPEEIKENKDKIKNTVKNTNKKTLTIIPIIAGIILAFLAIILKKRNNKTKLQKENNPSHNMDLTKNIPDTFKVFKD